LFSFTFGSTTLARKYVDRNHISANSSHGRRQKIFQGGGPTEKKPKISKKYRKIALFSLFQGGGQQKDRKMAKDRKIAFLSLYLLYLYHV